MLELLGIAVLCGTMACGGDRDPARRGPPRSPEPAPAPASELESDGFTPPGPNARRAAVGAFAADDPLASVFDIDAFEPIRAPEPGDWLAQQDEPGQSYDRFVASHPNLPTPGRRTIYLAPLGAFDSPTSPPLDTLADVASEYFGLPVKLMDPLALDAVGATERRNPHGGQRQLLTGDILRYLKSIVPRDAYCLIALTEVDLYPQDDWNFVFGMATLRDRVGVYSFARYHPSFYGEQVDPDRAREQVLRRSLKVMVHETAHMFGMEHCIFHECIVNGSNHLDETDARPIHACPVCLRKLHHAVGFDPIERYRRLAQTYRSYGLDDEADWVRARLAALPAEARSAPRSPH